MSDPKPRRVLVVEDNPNVREGLIELLESEELTVDGAADGEEALRLLATQPYDAMTLDLMMPVLDGWAVLEEMRQKDFDVPVLVVTARRGSEATVRALGAADVLEKPFGPEIVLARVKRLLDGHEEPEAAMEGEAGAPKARHLRAV